jgi:DNA-binding NarL/FixJ family response regulator
MREARPYRPAFSAEFAADELRRDVRAGRLDGEAVNAVLRAAGQLRRPTRRLWPADLTSREVEVLRLLARGRFERQIANTLGIAERTVHHHVEHIYSKLDVSTRAAATLIAVQLDLVGDVPPDDEI